MMQHKEEPVGPHGIMELIATLSAKSASGRVEVVAGGTEGALLFHHGKLVDARIGHLTGFQAINAVASMRDASFYFDPTVAVPGVSSISPSEKLVLKQFFGIETADAKDYAEPVVVQDADQTTVVPGTVIREVNDEVVGEPVAAAAISVAADLPVETAAVFDTRPRVRYLAVFALGVLLVAVTAAAVILRGKFRERTETASVATRVETDSPAAATVQPTVNQESRVTELPRVIEKTPVTEPPPVSEEPRVIEKPPAIEERRVAEAPRVDESPRSTETPVAATPDLTGEWNVVNTVDTTAYRSFQNLRIGFALSINQTGTTFTAKGRKVSENGRSLPAASRTPIELQGVINGDRIEATFSEQGSTRKTNGRFVWKIDRAAGGLTGTFASTAARTSGKSTATREL
jgi:hypothetical protein